MNTAVEAGVGRFEDDVPEAGEALREMTQTDIDQVIEEFKVGARNAIEAGFDGVEIHGANGYLIDQFLRSNSNKRTDEYGGTKENRIRLLTEITQAVADEIGKGKTGVRLLSSAGKTRSTTERYQRYTYSFGGW